MAYALKDSCNLTIMDRNTGKPFLYADYANSASLSISGESVFAKAKGLNKIGFEGAKTGTFKMETELFEFKFLALLLGGKVTKGISNIAKRETFTVGADKTVVLPGKAVANSISTFKVERDMKTHISEVTDRPTITVEGTNTKLVWTNGVAEGDKIAVYYMVAMSGVTKIKVSDMVNNDSFRIFGITSMKDEFGEESLFQFDLLNAKTKVNAELTLSSENVSSFSAEFELMIDENNEMIELTLLNDEATPQALAKMVEENLVEKKK